MNFVDLRLIEPLLRAVSTEGYDTPTPIQVQAIPHILEGRDVQGCAQTGTGKTAAFALPILQRLAHTPSTHAATQPQDPSKPVEHPSRGSHSPRKVRCLVLAPTRELALQISDSFRTYGKNLHMRYSIVFGGVNQKPQVDALRYGVDILVATPGRLLDLMNQRHVDLRSVEILVLDEADRMLDMGFIPDIRKIVAQIPTKRQTLMFSATMPNEIRQLANSLLNNPISVQVAPPATTVEAVEESVYFVERRNKPLLLAHLYNSLPMARAIVFTRTKHGADRVVRQLHSHGIRAEAIHGNKSQNARNRALDNFRACKTPVLVATDIASRGIDIDDVTHVVNYDLTHEPETYVHRIGRTARAGAGGSAVSFCDRDELPNLKAIEKLIRRPIPVCKDHPAYPASEAPAHHNNGGSRNDHRPEAPVREHVHHPRSAHQTHQTHQPNRAEQHSPSNSQGNRHPSPEHRENKPQARHPLHGGVQHHRTGGGARRHSGGNKRRAF